jgi:hypothetical protein
LAFRIETKKRQSSGQLNKMKEGETDAGLKTAALPRCRRATGGASCHCSKRCGVSSAEAGTATASAIDEHAAPIFLTEEAKDFRAQWDAIQVGFVDEPRQAVQQADSLVAAAMKRNGRGASSVCPLSLEASPRYRPRGTRFWRNWMQGCHCIGGFVVSVLYGLPRPTGDVDYVSAVPYHRIQDLQALAGRGSELENKFKVDLQHVTVATMPEDYEARLLEMFAGRFENLRMFAPDPYGLVLSKLERNSPKDQGDVEYLAKRSRSMPRCCVTGINASCARI